MYYISWGVGGGGGGGWRLKHENEIKKNTGKFQS